MKRTILTAALAITALLTTSSKSEAQIITAGFGTPYPSYGYYPYSVYNNYGYNYGSSFSFGYGNAYRPPVYGNNYLPYQGRPYGSAYYGPRNYGGFGYSNFNSGYRGRGYRR